MSGSQTILIRCDGSSQIGFGHLVRCLALATEFRQKGCEVSFAMKEGPVGFEMVEAQGFPLYISPTIRTPEGYCEWISDIWGAIKPNTLILDVRDDLPRSILHTFKESGSLLVTIDDPSDRRLDADLAFYPPVPLVHRVDWTGFSGELYSGWDWVILRQAFSVPASQYPRSAPVVLITMGGSDPTGFTLKAVAALDTLEETFKAVILLGPGFLHHESLRKLLGNAKRRFEIREREEDMPTLLANVDLAITAFGVTAYELAAMGVPALYMCLSQDHAESATIFTETGMGISLGLGHEISSEGLAAKVVYLLREEQVRMKMAGCARNKSSWQGARNVVQKVIEKKNEKGMFCQGSLTLVGKKHRRQVTQQESGKRKSFEWTSY